MGTVSFQYKSLDETSVAVTFFSPPYPVSLHKIFALFPSRIHIIYPLSVTGDFPGAAPRRSGIDFAS